MPFCTCNDITLYHEIHGEGLPLLLISGLSGGTWSWYGQVPFFRDHYRTIIYDNRGAGRSDMPAGPYHMKQLAADALCILNHLCIERTFVLALSMGGMIAQELALLAPTRIRALLLGCTHCGGSLRVPPHPQAMQILLNNEGLTQEQIIEKNLPIFFSETCLKHRPDLIAAYRSAQRSSPLQPDHAFKAQLTAISTFDCCDRLPAIEIPTMIATGDKDLLIPQENAHYLVQHIPQAELAVLPDVSHAIHAECPDQLNSMAHGFFQRYAGV